MARWQGEKEIQILTEMLAELREQLTQVAQDSGDLEERNVHLENLVAETQETCESDRIKFSTVTTELKQKLWEVICNTATSE